MHFAIESHVYVLILVVVNDMSTCTDRLEEYKTQSWAQDNTCRLACIKHAQVHACDDPVTVSFVRITFMYKAVRICKLNSFRNSIDHDVHRHACINRYLTSIKRINWALYMLLATEKSRTRYSDEMNQHHVGPMYVQNMHVSFCAFLDAYIHCIFWSMTSVSIDINILRTNHDALVANWYPVVVM